MGLLVLAINFACYLFLKKKREDLSTKHKENSDRMEEVYSQMSTNDSEREFASRTPRKIEVQDLESGEKNTLKELNECSLFTIDEEEVSLEREPLEESVSP